MAAIKIPRIVYSEPKVGFSNFDFKPNNEYLCTEDNVFSLENKNYSRVASVVQHETNQNCHGNNPLKITGDALAALYKLNKTTTDNIRKQSIYINFDPNEGGMSTHFTKEGVKILDKISYGEVLNSTSPYDVTVKIYHKPYPPDMFLRTQTNPFQLDDASGRVTSYYYIDGTCFFDLSDNARVSSVTFLNRKLFQGHNAYLTGSTSNLRVKNIYADEAVTGNIVFKNKDFLRLDVNNTLLKSNLELDVPNVEITNIKAQPSRRGFKLEVKPGVITFKLTLEAPNINKLIFRDEKLLLIDFKSFSGNTPYTVHLQGIKTPYKSYYTFVVEELQPVLDQFTFRNREFPVNFMFLCNNKSFEGGYCKWNNHDLKRNVLIIEGNVNGKNGIFTVENSKSTLEVIDVEGESSQHSKSEEIVHQDNIAEIDPTLNFGKILNAEEYTKSNFYHYVKERPNWYILQFFTNFGESVLHHFNRGNMGNTMTINGIKYAVQNDEIHAIFDADINGNNLLRKQNQKTVPVLINGDFENCDFQVRGNKFMMNNSNVFNCLDRTQFAFLGKDRKQFDFKLLKDTFNFGKIKQPKLSRHSNYHGSNYVDRELGTLDSGIVEAVACFTFKFLEDKFSGELFEKIPKDTQYEQKCDAHLVQKLNTDRQQAISALKTIILDYYYQHSSSNFYEEGQQALRTGICELLEINELVLVLFLSPPSSQSIENLNGYMVSKYWSLNNLLDIVTSSRSNGRYRRHADKMPELEMMYKNGVARKPFTINTMILLLKSIFQRIFDTNVPVLSYLRNSEVLYANSTSTGQQNSTGMNVFNEVSNTSKLSSVFSGNVVSNVSSTFNRSLPNLEFDGRMNSDAKSFEIKCYPYSYDMDKDTYVQHVASCYMGNNSMVKVYANVHQQTSQPQANDFALNSDKFSNCKPIEFYGRPSIYCEGNKSNMVYLPSLPPKLFDNIDGNVMLISVVTQVVTSLWKSLTSSTKDAEKHKFISHEMKSYLKRLVKKSEKIIKDLFEINLLDSDEKFLRYAQNRLEEFELQLDDFVGDKMNDDEFELFVSCPSDLLEEIRNIESTYYVDANDSFIKECQNSTKSYQKSYIDESYNPWYCNAPRSVVTLQSPFMPLISHMPINNNPRLA